MSELFAVDDAHDWRLVRSARGLLADFNRLGVLEAADVHVAARLGALVGETDDSVLLAVALAVRACRRGSVCVDLDEVVQADPDLPWPSVAGWLDLVAAGPMAAASIVQIDHGLLYLDRYWREEGQVRDDLLARESQPAPLVDQQVLGAGAERIFPDGYAEQRAAAVAAANRWTMVLTGGPGTGKTTAVAGLLALLAEQTAEGRVPRVALTAPTGKAAARLQEAVAAATRLLPPADRDRVGAPTAMTLHRLLGSRPGNRTRFRHHRGNRLPHDIVVCDETSMVSLTMMARLVEAVRPDARLVLVGDPDQLASVEAGAVLADLVGGLGQRDPGSVAALRTSHRFGAAIGALASAVRSGDADAAWQLISDGGPEIDFVDAGDPGFVETVRATVLDAALAVQTAAEAGDAVGGLAAMERHRLLCAHREGPYGAAHYNRLAERWLGDALGVPVGAAWGREWYAGRPVLITANDYGLGLYNGDTGVVLRDPSAPRGLRAVISAVGEPLSFATSRLADVETLHAMTVHKSQGSQAAEVTVLLPPEDSHLLSRELFYTAITRAQQRVRVVGTEATVRAAVTRRAQRASGLRGRLAR